MYLKYIKYIFINKTEFHTQVFTVKLNIWRKCNSAIYWLVFSCDHILIGVKIVNMSQQLGR